MKKIEIEDAGRRVIFTNRHPISGGEIVEYKHGLTQAQLEEAVLAFLRKPFITPDHLTAD